MKFIGCCGAYCRTCRALVAGACKGCKLGYETGGRDIEKAKCAIKKCCFGKKKLETCADCPAYPTCPIIQGLYAKKGFKYGKYRQATEFIRANGYPRFTDIAKSWKGAFGRYPD